MAKVRVYKLAKDLNGKTAAAAKRLGLEVSGEARGFFSVAAAKAFQAFIEGKRRTKLREAILDQQDRMVTYSDHCREALRIIAGGVQRRYTNDFAAIGEAYAKAVEDDDPAGRRKGVQAALALNDKTVDTLRALQRLQDAYAKLPAAHADLANAVSEKKGGLTGILDFSEETIGLHQLFTELSETE